MNFDSIITDLRDMLKYEDQGDPDDRPLYYEIVNCLAQAVIAQQLTIIADKMPKRPMTSRELIEHKRFIERNIAEGNPPPERPTGTNSAF